MAGTPRWLYTATSFRLRQSRYSGHATTRRYNTAMWFAPQAPGTLHQYYNCWWRSSIDTEFNTHYHSGGLAAGGGAGGGGGVGKATTTQTGGCAHLAAARAAAAVELTLALVAQVELAARRSTAALIGSAAQLEIQAQPATPEQTVVTLTAAAAPRSSGSSGTRRSR